MSEREEWVAKEMQAASAEHIATRMLWAYIAGEVDFGALESAAQRARTLREEVCADPVVHP